MHPSCTKLLEEIAECVSSAHSFEDRWRSVNRIFHRLGANAVNAAAIDKKSCSPIWFRSTLPINVISEYSLSDLWRSDLIVRHAATKKSPLVWNTVHGWDAELDNNAKEFVSFVKDNPYRSIACFAMDFHESHCVKCLTYCSELPSREVLTRENLELISLASNLLISWIGWPEDFTSVEFVRYPRPTLTDRERDALRHLAGGLMTARIAEAMGTSEAMVAKHMLSARRKLGARTREEALAVAIRQHQLSVSRYES